MRNGMQPILALLLGGMLWAAAAQADERQANDIRDRAHALQEKVQHLRDRGDHEAAQRLEQEVQELFQQADQVADAGPHERPPAEAWRQEFHDLYREWIEAIVGERDEAAEALQQKIHDYARETGARLQEMLQPQLEMVKRRIAELREQGRPELAERLAERQREVFQAHRRAQTAQQEAERAEKSRSTQGSDEPAWQRQVQDLKRRIDKLHQQGDHEQAERMARELDRLHERRAQQAQHPALERDREPRDGGRPGSPRPAPQQREEMQRRMQHLRGAADNLHAIGMHDLGERLQREADELQRALEPPQPHGEGLPPRILNEIEEQLRGLHKRLDEINRRLDELLELARQESR